MPLLSCNQSLFGVSSGQAPRFEVPLPTEDAPPPDTQPPTPVLTCPAATNPNVYISSVDFSGIQDCRQWSYLDSTGTRMTYAVSNKRWVGSEANSMISNFGSHPGNNSDAIRRWTSPAAGNIRITGSVSDGSGTCGTDGVDIVIKKGSSILWQTTIAANDVRGGDYDLPTSVVAGDVIDFVVNKKIDNTCDSTNFDPKITFSPLGSPPPPAPPITCRDNMIALWDKVTLNTAGATITDLGGYKVFYKMGATGTYTNVRLADPDNTSFRINNLIPGNTYFVALKSFRVVNGTDIDSAQTADVSFNLPACPP